MSSRPEVTVVIPTRDRVGTLLRTLATVLRQRDVDLEVLVVDDGSRDATAETVLALGDPRVRVERHHRSRGVGAARNTGIEHARATWVALLDDDDLWAPRKLWAQRRALDRTGSDWVYSGAVHVQPGPALWTVSDPLPPAEVARRLPWENVVPAGASNVMARRSVLRDVGGFDVALSHLADWDMWLRLLRHGPPAVVDSHDVAYRLHDRNMVLADVAGIMAELAIVADRHRDLRGGRPLDPTPVYYWIAVTYWRAGRRAEARRTYLEAWRAGHRPALVRVARTFMPGHRWRARLGGGPTWPPDAEPWVRAAMSAEDTPTPPAIAEPAGAGGSRSHDDHVDVSVIVPCHNDADVLAEQLEGLAAQDYDGSWELLVVDDLSSDGSGDLARSYAPRFPSLRVVRVDEHRNVAHARNVGVRAARGRFLLFCDADDVVAPGWIAAMTEALRDHAMVAGASEIERLNSPAARAGRAVPQQHGLQDWDVEGWELRHGGGGNLGIRRELYDEVGPFDDSPELSFAEAADYFFRAQLAGYQPVFAPDAVIHIRLRSSLRGIYRQARGWAEGSVALHRKFAAQGMPGPVWWRGLAAWALVPYRLLRVRDRGGLHRWVHLLGWRVGRLRGSLRSRMLAF